MSDSLSGKVAVITGAGGVLGGSLAKALAAKGARVALLDLKVEAARRVVSEIEKENGEAIALACNVLEKDTLLAARETILTRWQRIDMLLNGAGGNHPSATTTGERATPEALEAEGSFFRLEPDGIRFVFDLNCLGTMLPSQVFAQPMAKAGSGVILNISSMAALRPLTKTPAYSAAKAAVSNFTQWLAVHLAPCGIRVNAIAPGFFLTEQNHYLLTDRETGAITQRGKAILSHTPQARYGVEDDLHGAVLWLISDEARFVTGVVLPVDGGFSAFGGV